MTEIVATIEFGWYINLWKVLPLLIVLLVWSRLLTWADKDAVDGASSTDRAQCRFSLRIDPCIYFVPHAAGIFGGDGGVSVRAGCRSCHLFDDPQPKSWALGFEETIPRWLKSIFAREKTIKIEAGLVTLFDKKGAASSAARIRCARTCRLHRTANFIDRSTAAKSPIASRCGRPNRRPNP